MTRGGRYGRIESTVWGVYRQNSLSGSAASAVSQQASAQLVANAKAAQNFAGSEISNCQNSSSGLAAQMSVASRLGRGW